MRRSQRCSKLERMRSRDRAGGPFQAGSHANVPLTIAEAGRQIAAKRLSPVELTQHCLNRIGALDPKIGAFIPSLRSGRRRMRTRPRRSMTSGPKTPLDGIPIGYKDTLNTAGIQTTAKLPGPAGQCASPRNAVDGSFRRSSQASWPRWTWS